MQKFVFIYIFVFVLTIAATPSLGGKEKISTEDKGIKWFPANEPIELPSHSTGKFTLPNPDPPPDKFEYEIEFHNREIGKHKMGRFVHCWNVIYVIVPDEGPVEADEFIWIIDLLGEGDGEGFLHGVDEDFDLTETTIFGNTQDWTVTPFVVDDLTVYLAGADLSPFGETTGRFFVSEFHLPYGEVPEPATIALLGLGGMVLLNRRAKISR